MGVGVTAKVEARMACLILNGRLEALTKIF